ncbi:APC family permease [Malacoplasma penetrans]|uniref:APC family permease n=1 Tax=Malacoplasma penetrans TaxID=28227 RepID=UPI001012CCE0|nr:APC family permease [Malacoplasma penetrans]RXY96941.1 APC family permease [Malacoplasma penetrans]
MKNNSSNSSTETISETTSFTKEENAGGISQAPTSKKISFFSAMLIVMGGSIGAGIFFKSSSVLSLSQSSLVLAIFCWVIAAISVIAMALALVEISSARNDNLSLIGWAKVFCGKTMFKASKNFMFYIYLPLTYFFMPLYVIMSLQDGLGALINVNTEGATNPFTFGTGADWVIWTIISLMISGYFIVISGLSSKAGNIQNKVVTYIKFLPLAFVAVVGFVLVGLAGSSASATVVRPTTETIASGASLQTFAPGLGLFLAIGAIFFAYDGFYVAAGIQSEMKEPKKTPMAILIGLGITTAIYLIIAISMSINGDGSFYGMQETMQNQFGTQVANILFGVINLCIAIGVLGIINGFSMWGPRFTEDLLKEGELPFAHKYLNKLNDNKPIVGVCYALVISAPVVVVFTLIGALGYIDNYGVGYGAGMDKLYTFADLMANWTALFTFAFIMVSVYGGLKNRKTNKVVTDQKSYFKPAAIITIITVGISLGVTVLLPIIDLFLLSHVDPAAVAAVGGSYTDIVVSRIMLVVTLFLYAGLTFAPIYIENHINIKKFGSIEKYEEWQKQTFVVS